MKLSRQSTCLDNGLKVVTIEQPHLHSASLSVRVRCGSRHEDEEDWGLTHLLEHMLFRGSVQFPDARRLVQTFERSGGMLEAHTWRDHTGLDTAVHPDCLPKAMEALSDMLHQPRFVELDLERGVVEEELRSDLDEHERDIDINNVSRASIWHDHPLGHRIAGSYDHLRSFNENDLQRHHARHYVGRNTTLCVAGNVRHDEITELAARTFGALPPGESRVDGRRAEFRPRACVEAHDRDGSQLEIQLTFESLPDSSADPQELAALEVLTRILDDGYDSRLHQSLVERSGLVYDFETGLDCYSDCGLYDIEFAVAPERAAKSVETVLNVLAELCERGISDEELEFVRDKTLHELTFSLDCPEEIADYYGGAALFQRQGSLEDTAARIATLETCEVNRMARRLFHRPAMLLTAMGPVGKADMDRIGALVEGFRGGKD